MEAAGWGARWNLGGQCGLDGSKAETAFHKEIEKEVAAADIRNEGPTLRRMRNAFT